MDVAMGPAFTAISNGESKNNINIEVETGIYIYSIGKVFFAISPTIFLLENRRII